jgi:hypothetical protein
MDAPPSDAANMPPPSASHAAAAPADIRDDFHDGNDGAAAMQAAMGFSSFGDHQHKKRKYNHRADDAQLGDGDTPLLSAEGAASLPARPPAVVRSPQSPTSAPHSHRGGGRGWGGGGRGGRGGRGHHQHGGHDGGGESGGGGGSAAAAAGKPWWDGYYDNGSNENPWASLERARGLESKGAWLRWGERVDGGSAGNRSGGEVIASAGGEGGGGERGDGGGGGGGRIVRGNEVIARVGGGVKMVGGGDGGGGDGGGGGAVAQA